MRTSRGISVGSVLATAFLMAGAVNAQNLTLKREGSNTYLVQGKARLRIATPDTPANVFLLPNGDVVTLSGDNVGVQTKAGQTGTISLTETLKQWIHDDSKWNGHAFENYILGVYNHEGLRASLGNVIVFNGAALAVFNTISVGGSGQAIKSQQLVRVQTAPTIALQALRLLDVPDGNPYTLPREIPRLFVQGKSLLLSENLSNPDSYETLKKPKTAPQSRFDEIDADGKTLRTVAKFPSPLYPLGVTNNRWLVLGLILPSAEEAVSTLWLHDLQRHVTAPLPFALRSYDTNICLPQSGSPMPYLAVRTEGGSASRSGEVFVIHLPDGKQTAIVPAPRQTNSGVLLWNGLVVIADTFLHRISVYEAQTGRRVKTFALPTGAKSSH